MSRFLSCLRFLPRAGGFACVLALCSNASANGRFPQSNQLFFSPTDPSFVLQRTTFGLLASHDRGQHWDWVCEQSIGFSGAEDPMFAITPTNTVVGTTFEGITVTRDQACSWSQVGAPLADQVFIDLAQNPNDGKNIVAFSSSYDSQDAGVVLFRSQVWETKDEGKTWNPLGKTLDPLLLGYTIDLAKTDPNRIYATAVRQPGPTPIGALLISKDRGTTWEELTVPLVASETSLYIAAVDPNDAERVYLRTSHGGTSPDRLLLRESPDGGPGTLRDIYDAHGPLLAFALSPDGKKIYVGGPKDGVQAASTSDFKWTAKSNIQAQCLSIQSDGLWACSNEQTGFIVGKSTDDGATFQPLTHFCDIRGSLACPAGTPTQDNCTSLWPPQRALLGCVDNGQDGGVQTAADGGSAAATPFSSSGSKCSSESGPGNANANLIGAGACTAGLAIALARRARKRRRKN